MPEKREARSGKERATRTRTTTHSTIAANKNEVSSSSGHSGIGKTGETGETARIWPAAKLNPSAPTKWLAKGHLPRGLIAALVGNEGIGKSLWWVLVVAHLTTGRSLPLVGYAGGHPLDVALIITEDSWTGDVRPRLEAAGADLEHVQVICVDEDGSGIPVMPRDAHLLNEWAASVEYPSLIVADTWLDLVSERVSVKDPQQARKALHAYRDVAISTEACVLLVSNTNRTDSTSLRDLYGATMALRQKARVTLFAAQSPDDPLGSTMFVGPDKSNGWKRQNSIEYHIDVLQVRPKTDDDEGTTAILKPVAASTMTIQQQTSDWSRQERAIHRPSADERGKVWLTNYLTDRGGWALADDAKTAAANEGHNPKRLSGLLKSMGGTAKPVVAGGSWVYALNASGLDAATRSIGKGAAGLSAPKKRTIVRSRKP